MWWHGALGLACPPLLFCLVKAAPTPTPVPNPYSSRAAQPQQASTNAARGTAIGSRQGRPAGTTNRPGAAKPGPNARTKSRNEARNRTPQISEVFGRASMPSPSASLSPSAGLPSSSASPPLAVDSIPDDDGRVAGDRVGVGDNSSGGSARVNSVTQANEACSSTSSSSRATPQAQFIESIKTNVDANLVHKGGRVERVGNSGFPYNGGWAYPPLPSAQKGGGK